ncbi:MAG: DUF4363 family protein [Acetivibrionales bacterium]
MNKTLQVIIIISVIIVLILGISLISKNILTNTSEELVNYIERVEQNVKSANWDQANQELSEIEKNWTKTKRIWAMLIDHIEIDNIDSSMARMGMLLETREKSLALSEASVLRLFIKHIPEKVSFKLENIF